MCPLCQPPAAVVPPRVSPVQPVSFVGTFVRAFLVGLLAPWAALILGALLAG